MLPTKLPSSDAVPARYRPGGIGYWSGHLPFAFDLVSSLRPATFVELGTQFGESYFGFCQAIRDQGVHCSAFAVDTWCGDTHTGAYGEEVFEDVERHNRTYYEPFSRLLRMTFDDAAKVFDTGTIDLLHIDGLHTYEALGRDLAIWFPKVRAGGIVLIHDIEVRQGDFGVWRVWEELQGQYPSFSFSHSCGLGVIRKPGPGEHTGILALMFGERPEGAEAVRQHYELCADRLELRHMQSSATKREDINPQLFWRSAGEEFSEDRSVKRYVSLGRDISCLRLTSPRLKSIPVELRIDITDRPMILEVLQATVVDSGGQTLSDSVFSYPLPESCAAGLRTAPLPARRSVLLNAFDADNWLSLPLNEEQRTRLKEGFGFVVRMRRLSPQDYLRMLLERRSSDVPRLIEFGDGMPDDENGSEDFQRGLITVASLIAQGESDLLQREAELRLERRLAAEQAEQLETARRNLADRDQENSMLREALGAMTSSLTWRLSRRLRVMVSLLFRSSRHEMH